MLVKIKAIIANEKAPKEQDVFINPDYIQNASFDKDSSSLWLRMADGTRYIILRPYWLLEASQSSHVIKTLYDEFVQREQGMTDEEYDRWVDQKAKEYYSSIGDYPVYWKIF